MLAGCSQTPQIQQIEISSKPVEKPLLSLPPVDEINIRSVEWIIITENNLEEKLEQLRATGQPIAIFGLTGEGYENLGLNFSDIRALVQQQKEIIIAYENYYVQAEEAMENAVVQD